MAQTQSVRNACEAERAKIVMLRDDLAKAVHGLKSEDSQLQVETSGLQAVIERTSRGCLLEWGLPGRV